MHSINLTCSTTVVVIDVGGVGAGVHDRLAEMGYGAVVCGIDVGSAPFEPPPRDAHGRPSAAPSPAGYRNAGCGAFALERHMVEPIERDAHLRSLLVSTDCALNLNGSPAV